MLFNKTLTLVLAAASVNNISLIQSLGAAGNLVINGSAASGGVATLDVARRVLITSAGNDSGITFTVTGTDRYGRTQSETITGGNATGVATTRDFLTITVIAGSGATASTLTVGTNATASTAPMIMDWIVNNPTYGVTTKLTGSATYSMECSRDDFAPDWDMTTNSPYWVAATSFSAVTAGVQGTIQGPLTMLRLTTTSGTGTVVAKVMTPVSFSAI
jgi:hypothetical protein